VQITYRGLSTRLTLPYVAITERASGGESGVESEKKQGFSITVGIMNFATAGQ
jgi:hypothetical protein